MKRKNLGKSYSFYWRCINCDNRSKIENEKCCTSPMRVKTIGTLGENFLEDFNSFLDDELDLMKEEKLR